MPFAAGVFSVFTPGNPVTTGTTISSSTMNSTLSDMATGLSTALLKDGTQVVTSNIPMSSFKFTGLAAGSGAGDSTRYEQVLLLSGANTMAGHLIFTDNTYDIGASGATRPRDLFLSRNAVFGGSVTVSGNANIAGVISVSGVTCTTVTGTGALVYATSPTLVTPLLGTVTSGVLSACTTATQAVDDNSTKLASTAYADRLGITLTAEQASTSGSNIDFTGIPAGVKEITVMCIGVSTNYGAANNLIVQLGDAGGIEPGTYVVLRTGIPGDGATAPTNTAYTDGFGQQENGATTAVVDMIVRLYLEDASDFTWVGESHSRRTDGGSVASTISFGTKALSAVLTQVRVTTSVGVGSTFDAGVISVSYMR